MICIKNGWVHDAVHEEPYIADVTGGQGKITAIGKNLIVPQDCEIIDATDKTFIQALSRRIATSAWTAPGLVLRATTAMR